MHPHISYPWLVLCVCVSLPGEFMQFNATSSVAKTLHISSTANSGWNKVVSRQSLKAHPTIGWLEYKPAAVYRSNVELLSLSLAKLASRQPTRRWHCIRSIWPIQFGSWVIWQSSCRTSICGDAHFKLSLAGICYCWPELAPSFQGLAQKFSHGSLFSFPPRATGKALL